MVENQDHYHLSDAEVAYAAGSMFGAGSDTVSYTSDPAAACSHVGAAQTAGALGFMIMAAATHPEAQARVQAELEIVVGRHRGTLLLMTEQI